jgi:hypothetical protein
MPSWGEILREVQRSEHQRGDQGPDLDGIRDKYIRSLHELTGRAVIVYASGWLRAAGQANTVHSMEPGDVHGLMEVCHDVDEDELDLIIHSPGGSPEAAEQMLEYLRSQFTYIRALVPLQAKSAAAMLALGCDEIVMGLHSELGPIDPQILIPVPEGMKFAPAHAILRDFERAKSDSRRERQRDARLDADPSVLLGRSDRVLSPADSAVAGGRCFVARPLHAGSSGLGYVGG